MGANMGQPESTFKKLIVDLAGLGVLTTQVSSLYQTKAWGYADNDYLNAVILCSTHLGPIDLLNALKFIEKAAGRTDKSNTSYASRPLDLDILDYNKDIFRNSTLIVPHALMTHRGFVLYPLQEVWPDYIHPLTGATIVSLLAGLPASEHDYKLVADAGWFSLAS